MIIKKIALSHTYSYLCFQIKTCISRAVRILRFLVLLLFIFISCEWYDVNKDIDPDRDEVNEFGIVVAASDNYALIGAHYKDKETFEGNIFENSRSAYIFKKNSSNT